VKAVDFTSRYRAAAGASSEIDWPVPGPD
jgi:hypothetical protein